MRPVMRERTFGDRTIRLRYFACPHCGAEYGPDEGNGYGAPYCAMCGGRATEDGLPDDGVRGICTMKLVEYEDTFGTKAIKRYKRVCSHCGAEYEPKANREYGAPYCAMCGRRVVEGFEPKTLRELSDMSVPDRAAYMHGITDEQRILQLNAIGFTVRSVEDLHKAEEIVGLVPMFEGEWEES